jgi:hypothetical protein
LEESIARAKAAADAAKHGSRCATDERDNHHAEVVGHKVREGD